MRSVGVGVGENADLAVAKPSTLIDPGSTPSATAMSCTSAMTAPRWDRLPTVQDLAAERHDGLKLAVARLLADPPAESAFDEEQLRAIQILTGCSPGLSWSGRAAGEFLPLRLS